MNLKGRSLGRLFSMWGRGAGRIRGVWRARLVLEVYRVVDAFAGAVEMVGHEANKFCFYSFFVTAVPFYEV
jgi:hypothetical protein